jgi:hypothetical protein
MRGLAEQQRCGTQSQPGQQRHGIAAEAGAPGPAIILLG